MEKHYWKMVKDTEDRVAHSLWIQEQQESSPYYGGFYDKNKIVQAKYAIYRVAPMIACYCNQDTKYYQKEEVAKSIFLGFQKADTDL